MDEIPLLNWPCCDFLSILLKPGSRFTNGILLTIKIRWKFHNAVMQSLVTRLQQNFAHAMTAQLLCQLQNFVAIC